jgi:hypothetical protein
MAVCYVIAHPPQPEAHQGYEGPFFAAHDPEQGWGWTWFPLEAHTWDSRDAADEAAARWYPEKYRSLRVYEMLLLKTLYGTTCVLRVSKNEMRVEKYH